MREIAKRISLRLNSAEYRTMGIPPDEGTWCQYGANLRKTKKMVRCVPVVPAGVQKERCDLFWHRETKRKNAVIPWLNSDKELIETYYC